MTKWTQQNIQRFFPFNKYMRILYITKEKIILTLSNKSLQQSPLFCLMCPSFVDRFSNFIECKHCRHIFRFSLNLIYAYTSCVYVQSNMKPSQSILYTLFYSCFFVCVSLQRNKPSSEWNNQWNRQPKSAIIIIIMIHERYI